MPPCTLRWAVPSRSLAELSKLSDDGKFAATRGADLRNDEGVLDAESLLVCSLEPALVADEHLHSTHASWSVVLVKCALADDGRGFEPMTRTKWQHAI
jgi:hypothetical protein